MEVIKALSKFYSATNMMLARELEWDINRVTPRIYELRYLLLVKQEKIDICKITGRKAIYWKFVKK